MEDPRAVGEGQPKTGQGGGQDGSCRDSQEGLELSTSKFSTPDSSSTVIRKIKSKRKAQISSDSSSDNDSLSLEVLRSAQLQKKVDKRIRHLEHSSQCSGRDETCKLKSKRRGNIEVSAKTKVS